MKTYSTKAVCSSQNCQWCNSCKQQVLKDSTDDFDEWTQAAFDIEAKREEPMSLDRAIEVATLAG
jgi:hypothetical protein